MIVTASLRQIPLICRLHLQIKDPVPIFKSDSPFVKEIEDRVAQIKASEEWRLEYMTLLMREQEIWEEAEEKGRKMGREEGREEGRLALIPCPLYRNSQM